MLQIVKHVMAAHIGIDPSHTADDDHVTLPMRLVFHLVHISLRRCDALNLLAHKFLTALLFHLPDPVKNPLAYKEMWEMRNKKGTRLVMPTIIRIMENDNFANFGLTREDMVNQTTTIDPDGIYPDWCVLYGNHLLKDVWEYGIDGLDLDYEPESSDERTYGIYGSRMTLFVQYLGQFIGPMSPNPEKLLIVDGHTPPAETEPYLDYYVKQNYGSSSVSFTSTFPYEKQVFTENIGAYWQTGGGMEAQAAAKAPEGHFKGGFGAFFCLRDYHTSDSGADKEIPYGHLRRAIQLQNPAVTK